MLVGLGPGQHSPQSLSHNSKLTKTRDQSYRCYFFVATKIFLQHHLIFKSLMKISSQIRRNNLYRIDSRDQPYRSYFFVAMKIFMQLQSIFRSLTKIFSQLRRNNFYRIDPRSQSYRNIFFKVTKIFWESSSVLFGHLQKYLPNYKK